MQRHVTNTKGNWSFINRPITNLRSSELEKTSFFECRQTVPTWQLSPSFLYIFGRTDRRFQRLLYQEDPALDTIDHTILVERLESYFGFSKLVLCWFRSYLENRRQLIVIGGQVSTPYDLRYGVPQGYVLVPLLFALYIVPLQDVIARHNLNSLFMQITLNY